jgi:hypothetical protein
MRKILSGAFAVLFVAGMTTSALAQTPKRGKAAKAAASKEKSYDFSADVIDGELARPDGENMDVRGFEKHSSLIRIRTDFIREIVKSAEDL